MLNSILSFFTMRLSACTLRIWKTGVTDVSPWIRTILVVEGSVILAMKKYSLTHFRSTYIKWMLPSTFTLLWRSGGFREFGFELADLGSILSLCITWCFLLHRIWIMTLNIGSLARRVPTLWASHGPLWKQAFGEAVHARQNDLNLSYIPTGGIIFPFLVYCY